MCLTVAAKTVYCMPPLSSLPDSSSIAAYCNIRRSNSFVEEHCVIHERLHTVEATKAVEGMWLHWLSLVVDYHDVSYLHDEAEGVRGGDGSPSHREWCVQMVVQTSRQLHLGAVLRGAGRGGVKKYAGYEEV